MKNGCIRKGLLNAPTCLPSIMSEANSGGPVMLNIEEMNTMTMTGKCGESAEQL